MIIEFKSYTVESEEDFIEDGVYKIIEMVTVFAQDIEQKIPLITYGIFVINLNTQTGVEMDAQRLNESIQYITNKFK